MIDNELGADMRALLAAGRDHLGPDAATIARLRTRIDGAVATAPVAAAKAIAVKLTIVAVTAVVSAGIYRYVSARYDVETPGALQIAVDGEHIDVETRSSLASQEDPPPTEATRVVPAPVTPIETAVEPAVEAVALAPPAETGISLAREIELVDRAALGLRRSDFDSALVALRTYADEAKGKGQLAQDASAIEVEVLCRRNDATAATTLAAFEHRWPHSAHRSHLRATCTHREEKK